MSEVEELRQRVATLREKNGELEEELYRLTRKEFVSELRQGKLLYWLEMNRQTRSD
jgi:hypothetical protein